MMQSVPVSRNSEAVYSNTSGASDSFSSNVKQKKNLNNLKMNTDNIQSQIPSSSDAENLTLFWRSTRV